MKSIFIHSVFACVLIAHLCAAQQLIVKRQDAMQSYAPGTHVAHVLERGNVIASSAVSEYETARYIVAVASPVNASAGSVLRKTAAASAAAARSGVIARLASVSTEISLVREYARAVNGLCIRTNRNSLQAIRSLPGVTGVYEDARLSSYPAPAISTMINTISPLHGDASGSGVKIGIIDTGIDYMHEALGGGFGAGYKVCGGYDLVNNDGDPMDDNGHGTHVAGIIAGDSKTIAGMASRARLYSYKALDALGEGYASTVIAAIERAMEDSVNVINLSLGTSAGDPDDILSQAVDNAVAAGIVVVAAAGNAGEYGTIGSPGAARAALTVGAVDAKNAPASFSSKGPVQKNFGVKPEVVAPGVSVLSAKRGGGYIAMSGTSMSTPSVTALAAVLCELHPSWNAGQIRDAIIGSAQILPYSCFAVGAGKVDPLKAVQLRTIVTPGMMSLGFDIATTPVWTTRETVYVTNTHSTPRTYTLSASASSSGIGIQLTPASVEVAPSAKAMIIADVRADNAQLSDNLSAFEGYTGAISAVSPVDTVRIPFAFFKGTMLRLHFDETPWQVIVHDRRDKAYSFQPKTNSLAVVLPSGTYDVLSTFFPAAYVVREAVPVSGVFDLALARSQAAHPVSIIPTDESGAAIDGDLPHEVFSTIEGIVHRASGISLIAMSGGPLTASRMNAPIYVSDVSPAYVFGYTLNIQKGNRTTYTFETAVDSGIADTVSIRFAPDEAQRLEVKYDIDSSATSSAFPVVWSYYRQQGSMTGTTFYDGAAEPLRYPFTQTSFYYKRTSSAFPVFHYREAYKY